VNLTHLRTFATVAELRHFARAAAACNLSQPAVSHQIALLEREVGARLFNRAARRVSLTVAGEVLLEEARRVLAAVDRARERMSAVTSGAVGRIRLGATATAGHYLLPALLARYRSEHPTYDLHFEIGDVDSIADRVARNDLDMAIIAGRPPTDELQARIIQRDELVGVQPVTTRRRRSPAPLDLAQSTWILREEGSVTRRLVEAWLRRHGLVPAKTMTFDGPEAVKRAVMGGLGVAMVSQLSVREDLERGLLAPLRLAARPPAVDVHLVDHPQKHHGAACSAMIAMLAKRFPRFAEAPRER
jgi:DNA-binding transcriptional LysR family regulator